MYEFSLSDLESSEQFRTSPLETRQAVAQEYVAQNGPDQALKQFETVISHPDFKALPPEDQQNFKQKYQEFYGIKPDVLPLEKVSFGTDVKDVALSGLAGASAIPKAASLVAGWFGADESKEYLLDIAKTTEEFYTSRMSSQGRDVQQQKFLSEEDGKWFGNNAIKKVFMTSAESLPMMIATAPVGGAASAGLSKAKFLPDFLRALEGGSKAGQWSHNMLSYGASEAGSSALVSAADAGTKVMKMDERTLAKSPVYQELLKTMSPAEARNELRGIVEEETVKTQFAATLVGGALSPGGAMPKLFQGAGKKGIVKETLGGIGEESMQEGGQSLLETGGDNLTTQRLLNPAQSLTENLAENVALGAASGGLMGGGMGFGSKLLSKTPPSLPTVEDAQQVSANIPLDADPEEVAKQLGGLSDQIKKPNITLGDLTPDEVEGIAAVQQKLSTADLAEVQRIRQTVLPLLQQKNPIVAPHVEALLNERSKVLSSQVTQQFNQTVPAYEQQVQAQQAQVNQDDLMDDWAETETDVQGQADARGRSVRFDRLKQGLVDREVNKEELAANSVGLPSTAEESAAVLASEATPAMQEAERIASRKEDAEAAFTDPNALLPRHLVDAITKMESDLAAGEQNGVITEGQGNNQAVTGGFPSTNPSWFKQEEIKKFDKENGTSYASSVNSKNIAGALAKIRAGQSLDSNKGERAAWSYLQQAAEIEANKDPELVANREYTKLEKQGFEFEEAKDISAGSLQPGDQVVIDKNGVPDKLEHKGFDADGNAILKDGVTMHVDPFETLKVIAQRPGDSKISKKEREGIFSLVNQIRKESTPDDLARIEAEVEPFFSEHTHLEPFRKMVEGAITGRKNAFPTQEDTAVPSSTAAENQDRPSPPVLGSRSETPLQGTEPNNAASVEATLGGESIATPDAVTEGLSEQTVRHSAPVKVPSGVPAGVASPQKKAAQGIKAETIEKAPDKQSGKPADQTYTKEELSSITGVSFSPGFLDGVTPQNAQQALDLIDDDIAIYEKLKGCIK